ncbi:MAG: hypothetical protein KGI50_07740 [Patescibacteria group bacterium]|nr:hypothetical protein [Patescibacteria group bacterium]MDE2438921.1 hypothetical protein [Patescibacteria group bacterium]
MWNQVDVVFVCRSGCRTPPEYDHRFTMFCKMLGSTAFLKEREIEEIKEPAQAFVEERKLKNDPIGV